MKGMRYLDSITEFFRSPKWLLNLLLGGVCILIPFVGQLALSGWHYTTFHGSRRRADGGVTPYRDLPPEQWPDFDFSRFVDYLKRGLWPFLVGLVLSFVLLPVYGVAVLPLFLGLAAGGSSHDHGAGEVAALAGVAGMVTVIVLAVLALMVVAVPLLLRAAVLQDFAAAFSWQWWRDFVRRMWLETLLVGLFGMVAGVALSAVGAVALCVGSYFTVGIAIFAGHHLQRQLLDLYYARGGEVLQPSPTLIDELPATLRSPLVPPPLGPVPPPPGAGQ